MVPTSSQDEAPAHYGVSREVHCSALKWETVPDTLRGNPKSSPTPRVPSKGTRRVPAPLHLSTFSHPDHDRRGDSPAWSGRGPGPPGSPQDEAGLTRKFETSHVGGATCRTPPIPRSAFEKDQRPGHLFEGNLVGEGTTRRGTDTPMHHPERPACSTHSSARGLSPPEQLERQAGFPSSDKTRPDSPVPTLQGPCGRSPKRRGT